MRKNTILIVLLLTFSWWVNSCAQKEAIAIDPDGFGSTSLDNNVKILFNIDKTTSLTGARILIGGGILTETSENNGISNLTVKMLLKGNDQMNADQITEKLDFLGAQVAADCFRDFTAINIVCLSKNFEEAFNIISRSLIAPTFPETELEKLKIEIEGTIRAESDDQERSSAKLYWKTIYGDNAYGLPLYGTVENIRKIDAAAIKGHCQKYMGGNNIIVAFSSDLPLEKLMAIVSTLRELPSDAETIPTPNLQLQTGKEGFINYDRNQSFIFYGYPLKHLSAADVPLLMSANEVMGRGIGSRLWGLRQKEQLAYTVYSQFGLNKYDAIFRAGIGTDTSKVAIALASLDREMKKLYDDGITEGELADARVRIKNSLIYQIDQKEKRAINMAYYEFIGYGYKFINELIAGVDKVTVAEANRFIKENFTPDKLYLAVVGKK